MLGSISHTSIRSGRLRERLPFSRACIMYPMWLWFCSPGGWVSVPSLKVQLHYTTVFSTVNRRVLLFTQCTMFVHSPFIFIRIPAILQDSFSVKNRHNTAPARARGGHILRFFPAEAPHARRAGRYCLPRTPEFHHRSGTRPAGG